MAVFYRTARLEPLAFDHFWLSDTPEVIGSKNWGPSLARMVTWVKFRDRQTQRQFIFINTHFDHQVQEAREKIPRCDERLDWHLIGHLQSNKAKYVPGLFSTQLPVNPLPAPWSCSTPGA